MVIETRIRFEDGGVTIRQTISGKPQSANQTANQAANRAGVVAEEETEVGDVFARMAQERSISQTAQSTGGRSRTKKEIGAGELSRTDTGAGEVSPTDTGGTEVSSTDTGAGRALLSGSGITVVFGSVVQHCGHCGSAEPSPGNKT